LQSLNNNLKVIREITDEYQRKLMASRMRENPPEGRQAVYAPGDLVLYDTLYDGRWRKSKFHNRGRGPYEVTGQEKNDVRCRHVCTGVSEVLPVDRLSLFTGTVEQARRLALEDKDQDVIDYIDAYRGDPEQRTTMEFHLKFLSEDEPRWYTWSKDLAESVPYEQYCQRGDPALSQLLLGTEQLREEANSMNALPIDEVQPGEFVYVSLRYLDWANRGHFYDRSCTLPNKWFTDHVLKMKYTKWDRANHTRVEASIPVISATYSWNHWFVHLYGQRRTLLPTMREIVLQDFIHHPDLLELVPAHAKRAVDKRLSKLKK
jgi:hypothetical protein